MLQKRIFFACLLMTMLSCYHSEDYKTAILVTYEGNIRNSSQIIAYRWLENPSRQDTFYYYLDTLSQSALVELGMGARTYILTLDSCALFRDTISEIQFTKEKRNTKILNFSYLLNGRSQNDHYLTLKIRS